MAGYMNGKLDIIFRSRKYQGSQESRSVTPEMPNAWNETSLPTIL